MTGGHIGQGAGDPLDEFFCHRVQKQAAVNFDGCSSFGRMHAHDGALALASHGQLDLVAVAPALAAGLSGSHQLLGMLLAKTPKSHEG